MRVFVMAMVGLMVAAGAKGQQDTVRQTSKGGVVLGSPSHAFVSGAGCPGVLSARRQAAGGTVWTIAQEDAKDPAIRKRQGNEGVHVALKSKDVLGKAQFSVSYIAPGARVMPVGAADSKTVLKKTFELAADGEMNVDGDLLVGPAFKITQVHLISVTFADGQVWHADNENYCSVEPSGFLLVGAK